MSETTLSYLGAPELTPKHKALLSEAARLVDEYGTACERFGGNSRSENAGASARRQYRNAAEQALIDWISAQTVVVFTLEAAIARHARGHDQMGELAAALAADAPGQRGEGSDR